MDFRQRRTPARGISGKDYERAPAELSVELAAIVAVAQVESRGRAFDDLGRPTILFERHCFHRLTGGVHDLTHPEISNPRAGGYGKLSAQYEKLESAHRLAPEAALQAASWGRFQILGSNYGACGFDSVSAFVGAHMRAEVAHLRSFVRFVASDGRRLDALRRGDWDEFARRYNGVGYAKTGYQVRLRSAYEAAGGTG